MNSTASLNERSRGHANHTRSDGAGFQVILSLVRRRRILFILLVACSCFSVIAVHLWLPLYEAQASLFFENANSSSLQAMSAKLGTFGVQEDEGSKLDRYALRLNTAGFFKSVAIELRKSGDDLEMFHLEMLTPKKRILWNIGKAFHLKLPHSSMSDISEDEMADILDEYVYFNRSGSDRLNITVRSGDRRSASVVANVIADLSVKVLLEESLQDLDETRTYIDAQVKQSETSIHEVEDSLARLKTEHGILSDNGGNVAAAIQLSSIQQQLTSATIEFEENKKKLARLEEELANEKARDSSPLNASIDPQNRYGIPHRMAELKRTNEVVGLTRDSLKKLLDETLHGGGQVDDQKIYDLRKRMEFEYSIYQELKKQAFQLEMRRIGARNKMRVFEHAREAEVRRSDSLIVKLAIALILSIFGGLPVAMIWDLARPRVRSGRDLTDSGLAYLGGVPTVSGRFVNERRAQSPRITRFDTDSEVAMSFIQIRSRLLYLSGQRGSATKVLAIVSAESADGKSFFSRNLSACFGHMGRKTLLIDADLRKEATSEYFNLGGAKGLGEILTGGAKFGEVVAHEVVRGVDFVPAGQIRSGITDLFADDGLASLLGDLREVYDHVIIDTPSLIAVPDAPLIVRASDMPLLLASMNETTQQDLEVSLERIRALYSGEICAALNHVQGGQIPLYVIHSGGKRASEESRRKQSQGRGAVP